MSSREPDAMAAASETVGAVPFDCHKGKLERLQDLLLAEDINPWDRHRIMSAEYI